jgi:hypothetical protein
MKYAVAMLIMLALVFGWVAVQAAARRHAARHPEFGPLREEGKGCGCGSHRCGEAVCKKEKH